MKNCKSRLALGHVVLSAAMALALPPAVAAQPFPKPDTLHVDYFASLAYAGPRLRDCAPGLTQAPGTYDSHQYGLFLARWTGDRPIHHGATSGNFPPAEIRLPAFFGVERYYPEVHATAHFNFPHSIDETNHVARVAGHDPRLLSYGLPASADADFIYGPEFWPQKLAEALSVSLPPDTATDTAALAAQKAFWQSQAAIPSGTGAASKSAPENVVTSRWMSEELSNYLKLEIRGTIAKRVFGTETARVLARASILGTLPEGTLTLSQVGSKDVLNFLDKTPLRADTRRYFDLDSARKLKSIFSKKGSLIEKLTLVNPVSIEFKPIRMGYDEVVVFSGAGDGLQSIGTAKLPPDLSGYFELLQRWLHDRCDGAVANTVSYSLDYRTYMPWPKEGGQDVKKATAQALLPEDGDDIATHQRKLLDELWRYNDDILLTSVDRLDSLKARYLKSLPKVLIAEIAGLVTESSRRNLTAAEISTLRQRSKTMLELYCAAYKSQKQTPIACNDVPIDAAP